MTQDERIAVLKVAIAFGFAIGALAAFNYEDEKWNDGVCVK